MYTILILLIIVGVVLPSVRVYRKFESGQIKIDPFKHPSLHRVQRIVRANNTKARELELARNLKAIESKASERKDPPAEVLELAEKVKKNQMELEAFQYELDAPEREKQAALEAAQRKEEAEAEAKRQKEYEANRRIELQLQAELHAKQQEELAVLSRQERYVTLSGVYIRKLPTAYSDTLAYCPVNARVIVDGWMKSEEYWGNKIWFRVKASNVFPDGGWIWSGSVNHQSTEWLIDLNEEPETHTLRSFDGTADRTIVSPTSMEREIEVLKKEVLARKEINKSLDTVIRSETPNSVLSITRGGITAEKINANSISADKIVAAGGLTAPRETVYTMSSTNPYAPNAAENRRREDEARRRRERDEEDRRRRQRDQDFATQQSINNMNNIALGIAIGSMF